MGRRVAQRSPCHRRRPLFEVPASFTYGAASPPDRQRRRGRVAVPGRSNPPDRAHGKAERRREWPARIGTVQCSAGQISRAALGRAGLLWRAEACLGLGDGARSSASSAHSNKAHAAFTPRGLLEHALLAVVSQPTQQLVRPASSRYDLALLNTLLLLLTRACSRSARSGGEGRVSAVSLMIERAAAVPV